MAEVDQDFVRRLSEQADQLAKDRVERNARIAELEAALGELYDAAVQVVDVTNPDLDRERQRLSRLLDKYERLVTKGQQANNLEDEGVASGSRSRGVSRAKDLAADGRINADAPSSSGTTEGEAK